MAKSEKTHAMAAHVQLELAKKIDWMEEHLTLEALADVDAGRVIDHQVVHVWADSLTTDSPLRAPR
ncbi:MULTISPECIES: hypothetical protein [unclassified Pseudomonas]|uniref:hypothetical protein n=1 Tax=unclassified Pseudomonas TaxID=196821 RepID=UPI000A1FA8D8|nr:MULTISPECIES: hypothetical protein [unclassified Pseudomonas]